ncbi:MAG: YceD family protein [Lachnospiraceae bacterium]
MYNKWVCADKAYIQGIITAEREIDMLIELSQLYTQNGKQMTFDVPIEMDEFSSSFGNYLVLEKAPVHLVIYHSQKRKLQITGDLHIVLEIPCDRCLDPVAYPFDLSIEKELDMNESDEQRNQNLDEQAYIQGNELDVEMLVRGELIVNMPMKVLCAEECKGICNKCGTNLNHGSCNCDATELDPRMSVISDIFKKYKEV